MKPVVCLLSLLLIETACLSGSQMLPLMDMDSTIELDLGVVFGHTDGETTKNAYGSEVRYYVFDSTSGKLENTAASLSPSSMVIGIRPGEKEVWALSNLDFSRFEHCADIRSFKTQKIYLKDHNIDGICPMTGHGSVYAFSDGMADVEIELSHLAARINVKEIKNSLSAPLYGEPITISSAFLTNVISSCSVDGNAIDVEEGEDTSNLTYANIDQICEYGTKLCPGSALMFLPNENDAKCTRLVVDAMIGGERYYYPVNISGALRNHTYDLALEITRPGSTDPESMDFGLAGEISLEIEGFEDGPDEIVIIF